MENNDKPTFFKRPSDATSPREDNNSDDSKNDRRPRVDRPEDKGERVNRPERKPFDRDKKPFDRDRKPFDRDKKPFDRDKKPFDRDKKPFDRDRKPFDRDKKPFDRDRKPFDRDKKPFDRDRKPYDNDRKPYDRDRKPYDNDRKPYDNDRKPYDNDRKPFDRDRKPYDNDRKPRYEEPAPLQAPENIIFGIHPVREALEAGVSVEKIYVKKGTDAAESIIEYADARGIQIQEVPIEKLDKLTRRNNHQGIVAVVPPIEYADFNQILEDVMAADKPSLFVVVDSITDIRNFGAIARTAECVGADAIIMPAKNSAPVNAEAIKSSAGALNQIPVCRVGSLRNTLKSMQMAGVQLVAATEKSTELLYESKLTGHVAIIMGAEDDGIAIDILRMCDQKISIPMLGRIESLNVSAAAAVILYEVVRQRFEAEEE